MENQLKQVDHSALRTNQWTIVVLSVFAFVFNLPWLALLVGLIMLVGMIIGVPGFLFIYRNLLKPLGLVKPDIIADNPEPHRFAQGLGAIFMLAGAGALYAGVSSLGWGLVWLVVVLAALNALAGFCVGCMLYYWLSRLKAPGFVKSPPEGVVPGMRPRRRTD